MDWWSCWWRWTDVNLVVRVFVTSVTSIGRRWRESTAVDWRRRRWMGEDGCWWQRGNHRRETNVCIWNRNKYIIIIIGLQHQHTSEYFNRNVSNLYMLQAPHYTYELWCVRVDVFFINMIKALYKTVNTNTIKNSYTYLEFGTSAVDIT
jgi:hypothetical protein